MQIFIYIIKFSCPSSNQRFMIEFAITILNCQHRSQYSVHLATSFGRKLASKYHNSYFL